MQLSIRTLVISFALLGVTTAAHAGPVLRGVLFPRKNSPLPEQPLNWEITEPPRPMQTVRSLQKRRPGPDLTVRLPSGIAMPPVPLPALPEGERVDLRSPETKPMVEPALEAKEGPAAQKRDVQVEEGRKTGTLTGVIRGPKGPVRGARIFLRGLETQGVADRAGVFTLTVPAGDHDVTIVATGFGTTSKKGVKVTEGEVATLDIQLESAGVNWLQFRCLLPISRAQRGPCSKNVRNPRPWRKSLGRSRFQGGFNRSIGPETGDRSDD